MTSYPGTQMNLSFMSGENTYPFINHMKTAGVWNFQFTPGTTPGDLDSNGYPLFLPAGEYQYCVIDLPPTSVYSGEWVLEWDGDGEIRFPADGSMSENVELDPDTNASLGRYAGDGGKVYVTIGSDEVTLRLQQTDRNEEGNHVRNIRVYRADHEAAFANGDEFNPFFVGLLSDNISVIRFMDWQQTNSNNVTNFAHVMNDDYAFYANDIYLPNFWYGDTLGEDTYTLAAVDDTPAEWTDGEIIHCRFDTTNTVTNPTLNVGGRGAKTIADGRGDPLSVGEIATSASSFRTLIYSADIDLLLLTNTSFRVGITCGCPLPVIVRLCNTLNVHPWLNIGMHMDAAGITGFMEYVRDNLNSGLVPRYEFSNEVWNHAAGFDQTHYANYAAKARWDSGDFDHASWYAYKTKQLCDTAHSVYSGDRSRYQVMLSVHTLGSKSDSRMKARLEGIREGYTAPNRPIDLCHAVAITTYLTGPNLRAVNSPDLIEALDDYDSGDPVRQAEALEWAMNDVRQGTSTADPPDPDAERGTIAWQATHIPEWRAIARRYNKRLAAYEGGLGIEFITSMPSPYEDYVDKANALFLAAKTAPGLFDIIKDYYEMYHAEGGEYPSQFNLSGTWPWSMFHPNIHAESPAWEAIKTFNGDWPAVQRRVRFPIRA